MVALYTTEKKMLKNLSTSKQSDYDNRYQLLNGKVIQKTLTSHKFFIVHDFWTASLDNVSNVQHACTW